LVEYRKSKDVRYAALCPGKLKYRLRSVNGFALIRVIRSFSSFFRLVTLNLTALLWSLRDQGGIKGDNMQKETGRKIIIFD